MAQTLSGFDEVLKIDYERTIIDQINKKNTMLDIFTKTDANEMDATGKQVTYPIGIERNQGVISAGESENLPTAGQQGYEDLVIKPRYTYGRIQLTGPVIKQSLSSKGAFKRAMKAEMDGLVRDMSDYRNRELFNFSKGVLARFSADPATGTTWTLDAPMGIAGTHGTRFLRKNMILAAVDDSAVGTIRGAKTYTVSSVDSTTQVTVGTASDASIVDNDYVVMASTDASSGQTIADTNSGGTHGSDADSRTFNGLLGMVDDTSFITTHIGVSRSTYPIWKAYVNDSVGALSLDTIQRAIDVVDVQAGGYVNCLVTDHSGRRAYIALIDTYRRYQGADIRSADSGTNAAKMKEVTYAEIPLKAEKYCPYGYIFGLDKSTFIRWVWSEGAWDDTDGNILQRVIGKDAFEAFFKIYDNFACEKPNVNFRLGGITTSVIAVPAY